MSVLEQLDNDIPVFAGMKATVVHLRQALEKDKRIAEEALIEKER